MKNFQQFAINQEEANNIIGGTYTRREIRKIMNQVTQFASQFDEMNLSPETLEQIRPIVQEYYEIAKKYFPTLDQHISQMDAKTSFDLTSYMSH